MPEVPYQNAAQVEQLLAERENAEGYGQTDRVEAADKSLAAFGITSKADRTAAGKARREALEAEAEAADAAVAENVAEAPAKKPTARKSTPRGRSTAKKSTAKK